MRLTLRKRMGGIAAMIMLAGIGSAATATGASAEPAPSTSLAPFAGVFHPIKNVGNGKCLQPEGGSTGEVAIVQAACTGSTAQGWQFLQFSGSSYHLINQLSGLCMYMNGPVASRSPIAQVECTDVTNEDWKSSAPPPDVVTLMSRAGRRDTNLCIDVPGGSSAEGLGVQIFRCNGSLAQRWIVGF
ncbi:RICIN domain-containing protein [Streptomyces lunaelactis]|uniref:RICIN domain-containing protein n=1 Tax=Streptomyces lunaelactis TaxID=1535768 RepID=UPI0015853EAD|nr:RICIN domain-containing protein [Streptomyces lunaelactis]NUK07855.1 RICIN domain-containing protein [Streptomyces lunaelactis]NUK37483.1 RICIN domain-containing protein [Streptomyces lunaelactis]NUK40986.1 RICIN domain-containing protein [Streptomyces lunaelactis]NUK71050.1 RICIN domain-containing protein [Streptomyces lunaelactis]NUK82425.1 RICIN domain-containing protein [Streptomyces lunaelactis]